VITDGIGNLYWLSIVQRVVPAHNALQLREFPDYSRGQISLA